MALRKKAKTAKAKGTKAKSAKSRTKVTKATDGKATAKKAKTGKVQRAAAPVKRDAKAILEHLDLTHKLDEADIKTIRDCCTAVLDFRELSTTGAEATMAEKVAEYCYTKSGASTAVTIWKNDFKVEETTQAEAEARGIRPCG